MFYSAAEIYKTPLRLAASCELFWPSFVAPESLLNLFRPQPALSQDVKKQLVFCDPILYPQKRRLKDFGEVGKRKAEEKKKKQMSCIHLRVSVSLSPCLGAFGFAPRTDSRSAFSSLMLFVKDHLPYLFLLISLAFCSSSFMANTQTR